MAKASLRILCLHGLGRQEQQKDRWQPQWVAALEAAAARAGASRPLSVVFLDYDDVFEAHPVTWLDVVRAVAEMTAGALHASGRSLLDLPDALRGTAGMVAQWVRHDAVRRETRRRVAEALAAHRPDVVVAHSLGSLLAYDTLTHPDTSDARPGVTLLTIGSQLGSPFLRREFGAYLTVPRVRRWVNVLNPGDRVFVSPLRIADDRFVERREHFGDGGLAASHDAVGYLSTATVEDEVFAPLSASGAGKTLVSVRTAPARAPDRRALLVGIDRYPDPAARLAGCVNDTYLVSAALQEAGFPPERIRLLLDERATAPALRERLAWLLDDARPGDVRLFFFSGHGAQVPAYGPDEVVDSADEVLVTHDFDWSDPRGTGIVDDEVFDLYAQLPYGAHFVMILDCCHAGGMARAAGTAVRGLDPPDDVRHRAIRWDASRGVWVPRPLPDLVPGPSDATGGNRRFVGRLEADGAGCVRRLGCATRLRRLPDARYRALRRRRGHHGPYLPTILEACAERERAYEYEHGSQAFGAFTFTLVRVLRALRAAGPHVHFDGLVARTRRELAALGFAQTPRCTGPREVRRAPLPWIPS